QDALVERLWDGRPPERAQKALQVYVSQLRKALGPERLLTRAGGYALAAADGEVDAGRFERLVEEGRLEDALRLWRGPALADFRLEGWAADAAERLDDARLAAREARAEQELARGRAGAARTELEELVAAHPHRERARALLM